MARPKLTIRPVEKTISLPGDVVGAVDKILYSDLEGKIPHGAWSRYILSIILDDLARYNQPPQGGQEGNKDAE